MNRRRFVVSSAISALAMATPARAYRVEELPRMPLDGHGYTPAAAIGDAIPWRLLATTKSVEEVIGSESFERPRFSPAVTALRNQIVRLNGYINPLQETPMQRHFVLMAYPLTCPYCLTMGGQYYVEVRAVQGVRFDYDAVLVEGRFELLERDDNGFFYRLSEARPVRAAAMPRPDARRAPSASKE